ncbi:Wadjet anti-phage system protein JetD domain-containing protein [Fredinandcohnia sp. 179-A 10B2 NHS]|uniref:Wadjet anti-phage system protein JetD domain-containing protein n=1 Tax=Fredinandcohnia sp. 179-A 10B2 NHS TaxID=3235176 RepID=UPI0039A26087
MDEIRKILATFQKKTVQLSELEQFFKPYFYTYEDFSDALIQLEEEQVLVMVKSKGRTARTPSLAFQYRINKSLLTEDYHKELQRYRTVLHPSINLDDYYGKDPSIWKHDLPYLEKVNHYLETNSFPKEQVPAPERSFELVGDEKWIIEKGGKELLERVGLYTKLSIIPVSEPLMFAINPLNINETVQYHLIVENKTTYQGLLPVLKETMFSTLLYGQGKAIIKSIEQFTMQYPVEATHRFYYFGDIDLEGISIWYSLRKKQLVDLAIPFYQACLQKDSVPGKEYQKERSDALEEFLASFPLDEQQQIKSILKSGHYHPQETLRTKELQQIWRGTNWTS